MTVLLLQGLPGYESNVDLAQSIRRTGWNVLLFHYRGTWGTAGTFSQSSAIEDTAEAVRFLRDPAIAAKYRSDPKRLVVVGHSMGGFLAGIQLLPPSWVWRIVPWLPPTAQPDCGVGRQASNTRVHLSDMNPLKDTPKPWPVSQY